MYPRNCAEFNILSTAFEPTLPLLIIEFCRLISQFSDRLSYIANKSIDFSSRFLQFSVLKLPVLVPVFQSGT